MNNLKEANGQARKAAQAAQGQTAQEKFSKLRDALTGAFKEREKVIGAMLACLVANEHVVLLGPPGTAKSALARAVLGAFAGGSYFETLMTRYSEPSQLFGAVDLPKWAQSGAYERRGEGMLQQSHVAFVDEVFKCNTSCLNAMLSAMNERIFHEGAHREQMPLMMMVGASNELPESAELQALWDRFMMRVEVRYVDGQDSFEQLMLGADPTPCTAGLAYDLSVISEAQAEAAALPLAADLVEGLFHLRQALAVEGISVSDRRWKKCLGLLRAWAWLIGDQEVCTLHFEVLSDALWTDPREMAKVAQAIAKVGSPILAEAMEAYDAIMEQINGLPPVGQPLGAQGNSVGAESKRCLAKLEKLRNDAASTKSIASRIEPLIETLEGKRKEILKRFQDEVGL